MIVFNIKCQFSIRMTCPCFQVAVGSGGSRFPVGGTDLRRGCFWQKRMRKQKNWVPLGEGGGVISLDRPMLGLYIMSENVKYLIWM